MKVEFVGDLVLKEVHSSIILESEDGEKFAICMRDTGFEFMYGGYWFEAKCGTVKQSHVPNFVLDTPIGVLFYAYTMCNS